MRHIGTFHGERVSRTAAWREDPSIWSSGADVIAGIALFFAVFITLLRFLP